MPKICPAHPASIAGSERVSPFASAAHAAQSATRIWRSLGRPQVVPLLLAFLLCNAQLSFAQDAEPAPATRLARKTPETSQAKSAPQRDLVLFRNGDLLTGTLQSFHPDQSITWQHPDAADAIDFILDHVAEIQLGSKRAWPFHSTNHCHLRLTNQDQLEGDLVACDSELVALDTWYAGRLTFPRRLVQSILPTPPKQSILFEGPSGLDGWTMGKVVGVQTETGQWKYNNSAFYATRSASIARDVHLPPQASIQFDLDWKGILQLAFALYTDYLHPISLTSKETEPDFGPFYSLQINSFYANLLPVKKNEPLRYMGQVSVPAFNQKNSAHVDIRVNKSKRTIALLIDGVLLKQWADSQEFDPIGTGIRIVHQGQGAVRLSNLIVSEWDGLFETTASSATNSPLDIARLRNGDRVTGQLNAIRDGKLAITSSDNTTLEIPLARVKQIDLAGQKSQHLKPDPKEIRVFFTRTGSLTARVEKWEAGEAVLASPNFDKATFQTAAFERLQLVPTATTPPRAAVR